VILFENLKIGFWKFLVILDLIFMISNSAKKWQKIYLSVTKKETWRIS